MVIFCYLVVKVNIFVPLAVAASSKVAAIETASRTVAVVGAAMTLARSAARITVVTTLALVTLATVGVGHARTLTGLQVAERIARAEVITLAHCTRHTQETDAQLEKKTLQNNTANNVFL